MRRETARDISLQLSTHLTSARLVSILSIACVVIAGIWAFHGLQVTGDIEAFVPQTEDGASAQAAQSLASSDLTRSIVVTITDASPSSSVALARSFAKALAPHQPRLFARIESGPDPELEQRVYQVYFPRRQAFVVPNAQAVSTLDSKWAAQRVASLREQLMGPLSPMIARLAPDDPWLLFPTLLSQLRNNGGSALDLHDGGYVVSGKPTAVVFMTGRASPFDSDAAIRVSDALDAARKKVLQVSAKARVDIASVYAFSRDARRQIERDINRISALSTAAIVLLFLLLFRSLRSLVLSALTLGAGVVAGACACRLFFGGIHGITLAFGASLLGVGIDFVAHYVNHCALEHRRSPHEIMRELWPGLSLGGTTTALGFLAFAFSSFAGMRELAVFSFASIAASLLATRYWCPPWITVRSQPTAVHRQLTSWLSHWVRLSTRPVTQWTLLVFAALVCAWGLPRLQVVDDVRVFNRAEPALLRETDRARASVGFSDAGRFVLVTGRSEEEALHRNDQAYEALAQAQRHGKVGSFRSAFQALRSAQTQRDVLHALEARSDLSAATKTALADQGFVVDRFPGADLTVRMNDPVTYELLTSQRLASLVAPFRTNVRTSDGACAAGCVAYLSYVQDVRDVSALKRAIRPVTSALYFDQLRYLERAYATLRVRTFQQVCLGLLAVIALCAFRYRSLRAGMAVITPALISSVLAIAVLGVLGAQVTVFHFAAALLVLSMGEDYAVFLLEAKRDPHATTIASVSILIACVTTVVSFGLLALSSHPALASLGLVAALGVSFSLILAPTALLIAGRGEPARVH